MKHKRGFVYIMGSINLVLYVGVTNDLRRRVLEHKSGRIRGFTQKYKCKKLLYFEEYSTIDEAIRREKQLKNWHRGWKLNLIKKSNSFFKDLSLKDPETSSG